MKVLFLVLQLTKMKNKKNIYILLPLVIGIWGLLIYNFFSYLDPEEVALPEDNFTVSKDVKYIEPDTTTIDINHRDPFLGKLSSQNSENQPSNVTKSSTNEKPEAEIEEVINIQFKGIVSDSSDKVKVFMIIINGKTFLMKQGDKEQDVKLLKGNRESIVVLNKGKQNTISIVK